MTTYTTLLIDDEKIARNRLRRLLSDYSQVFEIIGEAGNGEEGLAMIKRLKPDLIFLDIQMPGMTGFEMLQELSEFPVVIFCTAYEEFALKAFNTHAMDYLVKPVETERLLLTIKKLEQLSGTNYQPDFDELFNFVKQQKEAKQLHSIPHKVGDRVILVKPEKITHFSAREKYVDFYTQDGKKYMTELSLKKLEEKLSPGFKRVQRSILVNINHIKEFRKYFRGKYILVLDDVYDTKIETGRSYTDQVKELFQYE